MCVCVGMANDIDVFTFAHPPHQAGGRRQERVSGCHSTVAHGRGISYTLQSVLGVSGLWERISAPLTVS